ncbi:MAG: carbohydrate kinase family protein [Acutalibacteraceae bacterium]
MEAFDLLGEKEPRKFIDKAGRLYPKLNVILTLGAGGSILRTESEVKFCPAFQVEVADTTAAGDTYTGFFIALLLSGDERAMEIASAAAGIAASKNGAASSIPTLKYVEEILPTLSPYPAKLPASHAL